MSESKTTNEETSLADVTVDFGSRFADSDLFNQVFQQGMGLVEQTASYLDGAGREESRDLGRNVAMAYATESMRLTTRLMQLASWLLLQRAVKDGEMTHKEAQDEKYRINLSEFAAVSHRDILSELPESLMELIARSHRLHERIVHLDEMLNSDNPSDTEEANPVSDQMSRLHAAFGTVTAERAGK
jgi:regulator of CtrA degradation